MGLGETAVTRTLTFVERFAWYRELGLEPDRLCRMLLVECERNLALLDCLELDKTEHPVNDSAYVEGAARLDTDVLEILFADGDLAHKTLQELDTIEWDPDTEDENQNDATALSLSAAHKIRRLYVAMATARQAADLVEADVGKTAALKKVNFRKRLRNIKKNTLRLVGILHSEILEADQ